MNLSPLRQIFSDVTTRAAQFYKNSIPLSGQQTLSSLKQFLTPTFANYNSPKQNDVIFHRLSQSVAVSSSPRTLEMQTRDEAAAEKVWAKLSPEIQQQIAKAIGEHKNDLEFKEFLTATIKDPKFSKLTRTGQKVVIGSLDFVAKTENYQKMQHPEKLASLYVISDLSLYAVMHPQSEMAWNTLQILATGKVKIGMENLSKSEFNNVLGTYKPETNTIYFNIGNPALFKNSQQLMRTAAHETNHALNVGKAKNRVEEFLDEYRAYYVEGAAIGEYPPPFAKMKEDLKTLLTKRPYEFYKEYGTDPGFEKVVKSMLTDYEKGKITTPEELRLRLVALPGREKSVYLNTKPNLDNHP